MVKRSATTTRRATARSRRARGDGGVWRDGKGWVAQIDLGMVDGRRVRARTEPEARATLCKLQAAADSGLQLPDTTTTTGDWLNFWLDEILPGTVRPTTEDNYRVIVRTYLMPHLGAVKLSRLGPEHVQRMMRALEDKGRSPRTRALARTVLRRALGQAERWGRVPRNVVALTDPPRKSDARLDDTLSATEAARVLETARGDRLEALAVLVLAVGLRQGEALRVRWEDVDLDAGTITIRVAKTDAGRRTVALPPMVSTSLKEHRRRQLEERVASQVWVDPELVFTTTIGTMLDRRNVLRWWHDLTTRAEVGRRRFHASRHTAATLMLNNGVPLEVVSKTLGHAGLAITADVYAEVGAKLQREAADAMERVLGGPL